MREARYIAVRSLLEDNIKIRDKADEKFQSFFEQEVHRLHNDVRRESEVYTYICTCSYVHM